MSFTAFVWAWQQPLAKDEHLIVLLTLANIANENNEVYAGQPYIAALARKEERTVRRALVAMLQMEDSPISVRARPGTTDVITLNIPKEFSVKQQRPPADGKKRGRPVKTLATVATNGGHEGEKPPSMVSDEPIIEPVVGTQVVLATPDPFEVWWAEYPRKMAKKEARKAWGQMTAELSKLTLEVLMERTRAFASAVVHKDPEHIAHGATWLRGERWNDQLPTHRSQTDGQPARTTAGADYGAQRAAARQQAMVDGVGLAVAEGRRKWW